VSRSRESGVDAVTGREAVVERFRRLAKEAEPDLFEGALLIAQLVDPEEDIVRARERAGTLAARVREAREREGTGFQALLLVLFAEEGFCGDAETYDEPANSSVARVLASRRGMPITLSIVAIEVGRRAGLALSGVGLPGHFVVGGPDLPSGRFLDPFDGGELYDAEALAARVGQVFGAAIELPPEAFLPDSSRAILTRVLFNLRRSWEKRGRFAEALAALECAGALDPSEASVPRERGLLLLRLKRPEEAIAALEAYLAAAPGEDREAIAKLIGVVRDRGISLEGDPGGSPEKKKIFTLAQAREVLPRVRELTWEAFTRYGDLGEDSDFEDDRQKIVRDWIERLSALGVEVKGLWLVDFDSGAGYYCWKYPEQSLDFFHGYEEGFAGRLPLQ
jgi:regulator of sirC expression with transglutaminase-like and TPR domain